MFWDNFYSACLEKGTKPNPLAKELQIASGSMTAWKSGKLPNGETLLKIANHLDVSVDYLLGRTENPNINNNGTSISQKYIGGDANASITNHSETKTTDSDSDDTISELVAVFKTLDFCDKAKVMSLIAELSTK